MLLRIKKRNSTIILSTIILVIRIIKIFYTVIRFKNMARCFLKKKEKRRWSDEKKKKKDKKKTDLFSPISRVLFVCVEMSFDVLIFDNN